MLLDVLGYDIDCYVVVAPFRYDDIGISLGGFYELQVAWTNRILVSLQDGMYIPSTFNQVGRIAPAKRPISMAKPISILKLPRNIVPP